MRAGSVALPMQISLTTLISPHVINIPYCHTPIHCTLAYSTKAATDCGFIVSGSQFWFNFSTQVSCQVGQSVLLGYLADSFNEADPSNDSCGSSNCTATMPTTKNAYLYAAGKIMIPYS